MSANPYRTFHYHASAHAFSAKFTRPFEHQIDVLAGSVLPIVGGHGQARAENFQFREFLSFRKGYTHVSGADEKEKVGDRDVESHNTLVIAAIEGLNILDIVTADRIVARLYSQHREGEKEGSFTIVGSRFENLRIADCEVKVKLDVDLFKKIPTYEAALNDFEKEGDFYKIAHDPFKTGKSIRKPVSNGAFLCSCVKEIKVETDCRCVEPAGHSFTVPGFGKIFLAEMLITHGQRTLTMIRFEIGSAVSGSGTVSQADGNGQPWPPTP
jgi:hypothetical protein